MGGLVSDSIHEMLSAAAAKGDRIRGGCASCDAYQVLTEESAGVGTWSCTTMMTVRSFVIASDLAAAPSKLHRMMRARLRRHQEPT